MIVKNNIAIRIAGKISRYIDASMNRATPTYHAPIFDDKDDKDGAILDHFQLEVMAHILYIERTRQICSNTLSLK